MTCLANCHNMPLKRRVCTTNLVGLPQRITVSVPFCCKNVNPDFIFLEGLQQLWRLRLNWAFLMVIASLYAISYTSISSSFHQFITNPTFQEYNYSWNVSKVGEYFLLCIVHLTRAVNDAHLSIYTLFQHQSNLFVSA